MSRLMKVVKVEVKYSESVAKKMGTRGEYHVVTVETVPGVEEVKLPNGKVVHVEEEIRRTAVTSWVDSPIPGREEIDFLATLQVGQYFKGNIETRALETPTFIPSSNGPEYQDGIQGRYVWTASTLVIGDSDDRDTYAVKVLSAFKQRNFWIKGSGDAGAPGGNADITLERERTRMQGHSVRANLPKPLAEADPEEIVGYSDESSVRNQDQGTTQR